MLNCTHCVQAVSIKVLSARKFYGDKYYPFKLALWPTLAVVIALLVILPFYLYFHEVPLMNWFSAFKKMGAFLLVIGGQIVFMGWIFSELYATNLSRLKSSSLFGLISGFALLVFLSILSFSFGHNFLEEIFTPKGFENASLIWGGMSFLSFLIYWQYTKPEKNYL